MKYLITSSVCAIITLLFAWYLFRSKGIKFGENIHFTPGDGSIEIVKYWKAMLYAGIYGAVVGALFVFLGQ